MPLFENSNDIILIIGSIAGAICSIIAAIRLSRCEYVNFCKGLITIKRTIDKKKNETIPSTDNILRTPSTDTLNNNLVEV